MSQKMISVQRLDDTCCYLLIDPFIRHACLKSASYPFHDFKILKNRKMSKKIMENVFKNLDNLIIENADDYTELKSLSNGVYTSLKEYFLIHGVNELDFDQFSTIFTQYAMIHTKNVGYNIINTDQLMNEKDNTQEWQVSVVANKSYSPDEEIKLQGYVFDISLSETYDLQETGKDYSVISLNKNTKSLLLGPIRFINHDCNPNCKFSRTGNNTIGLKAIADIRSGEEFYVNFSEFYFIGEDCFCNTCNALKGKETCNQIYLNREFLLNHDIPKYFFKSNEDDDISIRSYENFKKRHQDTFTIDTSCARIVKFLEDLQDVTNDDYFVYNKIIGFRDRNHKRNYLPSLHDDPIKKANCEDMQKYCVPYKSILRMLKVHRMNVFWVEAIVGKGGKKNEEGRSESHAVILMIQHDKNEMNVTIFDPNKHAFEAKQQLLNSLTPSSLKSFILNHLIRNYRTKTVNVRVKLGIEEFEYKCRNHCKLYLFYGNKNAKKRLDLN
eukprot:NODE_454_length_7238_cov_0.603306.p1 type:complete len:497 gc:universal NODE_454_length_7238_cov_0.603306:2179-3669(+)